MVDITWKLFCQTGNIETYLLLKELESDPNQMHWIQSKVDQLETVDTEVLLR